MALPAARTEPRPTVITDSATDEIKAIRASSKAQSNLDRATQRMIDFYQGNDRWLLYHDHNHLRISCITRSLALLKSGRAAQEFLSVIEGRVEDAGNPVNSDSRRYWRQALVV